MGLAGYYILFVFIDSCYLYILLSIGYDKTNKKLAIVTCANQDPLQATTGLIPLLGIDVWEHAYYLQYKNVRINPKPITILCYFLYFFSRYAQITLSIFGKLSIGRMWRSVWHLRRNNSITFGNQLISFLNPLILSTNFILSDNLTCYSTHSIIIGDVDTHKQLIP